MRTQYIGVDVKGPGEILDHTIDWSGEADGATTGLVAVGDAIKDLTVTVDGDVTVWQSNFTDLDTTVFVADGTPGTKSTVTHTIETDAGRKLQRSVQIRCIQR